MPAQRIVIRTDANAQIALGHLKRCLSLTEALRKEGIEAVFVTNNASEVAEVLSHYRVHHCATEFPIGSSEDRAHTATILERCDAKVLLIDSYEIKAPYMRHFQHNKVFVIWLDDGIRERDLPCDLVINGNPGAETLDYPQCATSLLGPLYCILDPPFWDPCIREIGPIRNVLITMGGIDHDNLTVQILQSLERLNGEFSVTVIIGPFFENRAEIERQVSTMRKSVRLLDSPDNLYRPMLECDLAFSLGGRTLHELAALGRPAIGIALWESQDLNVRQLSRHGVIQGIPFHAGKPPTAELVGLVPRVFEDLDLRRSMSVNGSQMFDGKGSLRVAQAIAERVVPYPPSSASLDVSARP